ncbi:response regulator transcription factor [Rhodoferax saidenbachensis]|uniref:DNA-binding response regulator n=1 Tax=Rhodoferax saidenbachensis TaxID=1484693 RepID=A0A1P8KB83_9BURK|nr:response regulator transcription factor [Rhodoferax saidenbachensis]APW43263.1 DNA-binding response regulator [Rhodoferax saidenbachensis]
MTFKAKVLIVDDDEDINSLLANYLRPYGFETHVAVDGTGMRTQLAAHAIDLIVMDVELPETDGLSLTREVRQQTQMPIIMLSARTDPYDRVVGLENGADDYVVKPFEPRELVARIQAVLRRAAVSSDGPEARALANVYNFQGWTLDRESRSLLAPSGLTVALSHAEFRLLCTFLQTPRQLLSREQLLELVGGRQIGAGVRSIDLLVSRLRQKLMAASEGLDIIKTIRGKGYLLDLPVVQGCA